MSLDITKFREIKECDHMSADFNWWGNLVDGEGQGTCPDCGVTLDLRIVTHTIQYDDTDIEFIDEDEFCDQCGEMNDPCEDCRLCTECSNQKAINRCDCCGEGSE